jgi:hypothetical protein
MANATIDKGDAVSVEDLWSTADGYVSEDLNLGFRKEGSAFVIGLLDGSAAADGNPITNPGGYPHNVAENLTNQTDGDFAVFGGVSAWGDGASWTPLSYASMTTHPNGYLGLWIKWLEIDGVWVVKEWLQYTVDREFTPSETLQNERYFTPYDGAE